MDKQRTIKVFEFDSLQYGLKYDGVLFEEGHFNSLVKFNDLHKGKYFSIGFKKIIFKNYVGIIQIDGLSIEILPKIDKRETNRELWQSVLIQMLKVTKKLKVQKLDEASVNKQQIHLLEIYFEWFLSEVRLLLRQGLIKQYYKETSNVKALKGRIEFAGHISKNIVHKERFYTTHQVYDNDHLIHQVLNQALCIVTTMSKGNNLYGKCKTMQLDFPEVRTIQANEGTFSKLPKSRKTAPYETALAIARLIILNYAPNISSGKENMLALLFDMNLLWEEYILVRLKQANLNNVRIYGQQSRRFWKNISIRPDIVIEHDKKIYIIDTKWKNIDYAEPLTHDLRQMYVYNDYWNSQKAMLLYPSGKTTLEAFVTFEENSFHSPPHQCGLGKVSIFKKDRTTLDDQVGM
ncbi:MAG: restriction endonuclease, partial [Flavobacterium sp.]